MEAAGIEPARGLFSHRMLMLYRWLFDESLRAQTVVEREPWDIGFPVRGHISESQVASTNRSSPKLVSSPRRRLVAFRD